ncbi:hypothetical protein WKT22_00035 [Candidatus Lokiarchaeum ossiferum]
MEFKVSYVVLSLLILYEKAFFKVQLFKFSIQFKSIFISNGSIKEDELYKSVEKQSVNQLVLILNKQLRSIYMVRIFTLYRKILISNTKRKDK